MKNKEKYYRALLENDGQLNELDLGEKMGLREDDTSETIAQLLSEHKIEYAEHRACNYKLNKRGKRKIR